LLQLCLETTARGGPGRGGLAHPPVVDEPDRHGVQEVELLAPSSLGDDEARLLELSKVLHHTEARHLEAARKGAQRLTVVTEQLVEKAPSRRIGECPKHSVHRSTIGD